MAVSGAQWRQATPAFAANDGRGSGGKHGAATACRTPLCYLLSPPPHLLPCLLLTYCLSRTACNTVHNIRFHSHTAARLPAQHAYLPHRIACLPCALVGGDMAAAWRRSVCNSTLYTAACLPPLPYCLRTTFSTSFSRGARFWLLPSARCPPPVPTPPA